MRGLVNYARSICASAIGGWDRFWFTPEDPAVLGFIRICAGLMLTYTHAVWAWNSEAFFGDQAWITRQAASSLQRGWQISHLWWLHSPEARLAAHVAALAVFGCLTLGLFSRVMGVLAFLLTVSYAHRLPGALFGLDQINALLAFGLAVGPSGDAFSIDQWRRRRAGQGGGQASIGANIGLRLIQLHMCVIYFYAGISKLKGPSWWNGNAMWLALANYEYQSLDCTFIADWPRFVNLLTHVTLYWEISYCALVWQKQLRPLVIFLALPLHLGIALALGMKTFGLVMLIGNAAFLSPAFVRRLLRQPILETKLQPESPANRVTAKARQGRGREKASNRGSSL